ncbi:hypothetical protein [Shewanella mangrovisoli]|uniref:Uncharacterized protein n=1 Tax=Shewanella mangrovisoli TaxID=2864211 RepID=A0ABV4VEF4_9GAMM
MKEFVSEFLKLQNDRMKSPFFSAVVFSLLFYNWDLIYFLISSNSEALVKIEYVNAKFFERNLWKPFFLTAVLLIVPLLVNNIVQLITDHFVSKRVNRLNKYKVGRGENELQVADLEARKNFSTTRIELEVKNNIDGVLAENTSLKNSLKQYEDQLSELKLSLDSERNASKESREHSAFLTSQLDTVKGELSDALNELGVAKEDLAKTLDELDKANLDLIEIEHENVKDIEELEIKDKYIKAFFDMRSLLDEAEYKIDTDTLELHGDGANKLLSLLKSFNEFDIEVSSSLESEKNYLSKPFGFIDVPDELREYFDTGLEASLFGYINKYPSSAKKITRFYFVGKLAIDEVNNALEKLRRRGLVDKTGIGVFYVTEKGKGVAAKMKQI